MLTDRLVAPEDVDMFDGTHDRDGDGGVIPSPRSTSRMYRRW